MPLDSKPSSLMSSFFRATLMLLSVLTVFFAVLGYWHSPRTSGLAPGAEEAVANSSQPHQSRSNIEEPEALASSSPRQPASAKSFALASPVGEAESDGQLMIQKAIGLLDAGQASEAAQLLESVLKMDPNNEHALSELAMIYMLDLKQPEAATTYLQRILDINPANQIVTSELVSLYQEQGKIDDGLNFLLSVQSKYPASGEVAYGIGQLMSLAGRDGDAVGYLEKAAQAPGNEILAYRDLGDAYVRSGNPDLAVDSFEKSIAGQQKEMAEKAAKGLSMQFAEERLAHTKVSMVRAYLAKGDTEKAQAILDEVKVVMPTDEQVLALEHSLRQKRPG